MKSSTKLGAFGAALAVVLASGLGLGAAVGPLSDSGGNAADRAHQTAGDPAAKAAQPLPDGLSNSQAGYTFDARHTTFTPGVAEPFSFRILGPDGTAVSRFDTRHERELHLIVVSNDLVDYQHLHPAPSPDGSWSVPLALPRAGIYRAYADFAATGAQPLTLAAQLTAGGQLVPQPLPAPASSATVDSYDVRMDGTVSAGQTSELVFRVRHQGEAVTDLQPYLGAFGHLVAIRASDGAYLHVHPTDRSSARAVTFAVEAPSPGGYRLFLDFQHGGVVRTAAFTLDVPTGPVVGDAQGKVTGHGGH